MGMKNALFSLGSLSEQIEKTNNRLATGKKVNSAIDNALNYFVADSFQTKARNLGSIIENIGLGLNVLKQTDKALTTLRNTLEQAEGNLRSAMNTSGTNARATSTFAFRNAATGAADATVTLAEAAGGSSLSRFQVGDTITVNLVRVSSGGTVTVVGTGTTLTTTATTTVQNLLDNVNNNTSINPASQAQRMAAYLNDGGNIVIENQINGADAASGDTFALQMVVNTAGGGTQTQNNTLDMFAFNGALGLSPSPTGSGTQTTLMLGGSVEQEPRKASANFFREVLTQIRNTALDSGYNGVNLLQGDFMRIAFNEDDTTSISIRGSRINAATLGFTTDNYATSTGDAFYNLQSDLALKNVIEKVRAAKTTLQTMQSNFASSSGLLTTRQDFSKFAVKNFTDGSDLLILADINEEGATLSSLQTRQQLAVTSLSLANQADQAILRLF